MWSSPLFAYLVTGRIVYRTVLLWLSHPPYGMSAERCAEQPRRAYASHRSARALCRAASLETIPQSITWFAWSRSVTGSVTPIVWAVVLLTTSRNVAACWTKNAGSLRAQVAYSFARVGRTRAITLLRGNVRRL